MGSILKFPKVTVIIPAYNPGRHLDLLLHSLSLQSYPAEALEVVVVDNNSTDDTKSVCIQWGCKYLLERSKKNSYAARNAGISAASGEIIAFIDADCLPSPDWVERGVECLQASRAGVVAGAVHFAISDKSIAAIYDSLLNIQVEVAVNTRNLAMTANLFVTREALSILVRFEDQAASGSDLAFTARAHDFGLGLSYCSCAIVSHPTRNLSELIKKTWRTSAGKKYWSRERLEAIGLRSHRLSNPMTRELVNPIAMVRYVSSRLPSLRSSDLMMIYLLHGTLIFVSVLSRVFNAKKID